MAVKNLPPDSPAVEAEARKPAPAGPPPFSRPPRNVLERLRLQLRPQLRFGFTPWVVATLVVVFLVTIPLLSILVGVLGEASDTWRHLARTLLPTYLVNSAILMLGVGTLTLLMGVSTAWLTTTCDFPGRRIFQWALILPLAIPTYIIAFTYAGIFDHTGFFQQLVGGIWPGGAALIRTRVMSMGGVIFMMAFVLYPYVYLITRASFLKQSEGVLESSRILGKSPRETFYRVALPMARPAIVAGLTLVLMEVLNEYGAVKYLGVPTFTTGIFRAWFALGDANAAMRLSACLLLFVFVLIVLERAQRGRARFDDRPSGYRPVSRFRLTRVQSTLAFATCAIPVTFGFLIPLAQLLGWSSGNASGLLDRGFFVLAFNSFALAVVAALLAVLVALLIVYSVRLSPTPLLRLASRISVLGYSIPGAVIAVGVLLPFVWLDTRVDLLMRSLFGLSTGLILSGTLFALIFAYVVRFLAVAVNPVDAGFNRVCGTLDESARSLGLPPMRTLWKVDIPLLRGTLLSAALLVFVDVLKELPLTLILRPFNFDTLATRTFQLASDELVAQSAHPALLIILAGIGPIILLSRLIARQRH